VFVGAGDDIGGASDKRLERLRTAAKIVDADVEALFLEIAKPLRNGER